MEKDNKRNFLFDVSLVLVMVAILAVAGCQTQEVVPSKPASSTPVVTKAPSSPVEEDSSSSSASYVDDSYEEEEVDTRVPTKKVRDILAKQGDKVTSMSYLYQDPSNKPEKDEVYVKGSKVKIALAQLDHVEDDLYIDHVYIDKSTQTALGYCEDIIYRCKDPNKAFPVSYEKYARKNPVEWIDGVTYAEEVGSEMFDDRMMMVLQFEKGGNNIKMWVDTYYGVPLKIEVGSGADVDTYLFSRIAFNSVTDDQLTHPKIELKYT
jgi:hypothetical protein